MNTQLRSLLLVSAALLAQPFLAAAPTHTTPHAKALAVPPAFVRNTGQADPLARFVSIGGGQPIFFTTNDVRIVDPKRQRSLWLTFIDGATRAIDGEWSTGGRVTVLRRANQTIDEPIYRDVVYRDVWRGIDAHVTAAADGLKYSFEVAPGGDPRAIHLRYSGADKIELTDAGEIVLDTGGAIIIDTKPVAYQTINGRKVNVPVRFVQFEADVAFSVGTYDKTQPLVIDPTIAYSTYLGSAGSDFGNAIAVDATGAAYVAGSSAYGDFPTTPGVVQGSWHGDPNIPRPDAFVAKINAAGTQFEYVTYLGGYDDDSATGIAVDAGGNVFVTGTTKSSDFPTTAGAYRTTSGFILESFLAKLNSTGTALLYSTYFGGNSGVNARSVAIDASGNAYVVGATNASNLPVSASAQGPSLALRNTDAFLLKFNAAGSQVLYGTYIGGAGSDVASQVVSTGAGQVIIAGATTSPDGIAHGAGYQQIIGGGVFKSTDAGQTFVPTNTPDGVISSRAFAIDPSNLSVVYQGTENQGLVKTTDGGAHWTHPSSLNGVGPGVYDIAISPANTNVVLIATGGDIWRTDDGFATAARVLGTSGYIAHLAFAASLPSVAYATTYDTATAYWGIAKSTDSGKTWNFMRPADPSPEYALAVNPSNASTVFVGRGYDTFTNRASIIRSTDGGATWTTVYAGPNAFEGVVALAIDPTLTSSIWAGVSSGRLLHSTDNGATWTVVPGTFGQPGRIVFDGGVMYVLDTNLAARGGSSPIVKTTDRGVSWTPLYIRGGRLQMQSLDARNGLVFTGTSSFGDVFLWKVATNSTTNSIVWGTYLGGSGNEGLPALTIDGSGHPIVAVATTSADFPITSGTQSVTAGLVKFTADGASLLWSKHLDQYGPAVVAADRNDHIYVATDPGGQAWAGHYDPSGTIVDGLWFGGQQSNVGFPTNTPAAIAIGPAAGDVFIAGSTNTVNFPVSANAPQQSYRSGQSDAYVLKASFGTPPPPPPPPPGGINLALNKPVFASSSYNQTYAPVNAVDGSLATRWSSTFSDPQWIYVDLQGTYNITEVKLRWEIAYGADYQVQFSNDAASWVTYAAVANGDGGLDDVMVSGSARYIRIYGTRRGTQWGYSLYELEVYGDTAPPPPPPSSGDIALNRPVVSSSDFAPEYAARFAVDGNGSTRWSSQFSDPQWIYVDLGAKYNVTRVKLVWETAYAADFKIQVSFDAKNWTDWATSQGNTQLTTDSTGAGFGRYVRVLGTRRATEWGYSLWSFEVYGTPYTEPDVALHKEAVASSEFSSAYAASFVTDGNASTRWSSEFSDPQWIYVDLGGLYIVHEVKLTWETAYGADYQLQYSSDGVNWWTGYTVTGGTGGVDDLPGSGKTRFVRVSGTRRGTEWGYSMWSIEVFGTPGP